MKLTWYGTATIGLDDGKNRREKPPGDRLYRAGDL